MTKGGNQGVARNKVLEADCKHVTSTTEFAHTNSIINKGLLMPLSEANTERESRRRDTHALPPYKTFAER